MILAIESSIATMFDSFFAEANRGIQEMTADIATARVNLNRAAEEIEQQKKEAYKYQLKLKHLEAKAGILKAQAKLLASK